MKNETLGIMKHLINSDETCTPEEKMRAIRHLKNSNMGKGKLLKTKAGAKLIDIHPKTLLRLAREGIIPSIRYSPRRIRFRESDLIDYLHNGPRQTEHEIQHCKEEQIPPVAPQETSANSNSLVGGLCED